MWVLGVQGSESKVQGLGGNFGAFLGVGDDVLSRDIRGPSVSLRQPWPCAAPVAIISVQVQSKGLDA